MTSYYLSVILSRYLGKRWARVPRRPLQLTAVRSQHFQTCHWPGLAVHQAHQKLVLDLSQRNLQPGRWALLGLGQMAMGAMLWALSQHSDVKETRKLAMPATSWTHGYL